METITITIPENVAKLFHAWLTKSPMPTPELKRQAADAQEAIENEFKKETG